MTTAEITWDSFDIDSVGDMSGVSSAYLLRLLAAGEALAMHDPVRARSPAEAKFRSVRHAVFAELNRRIDKEVGVSPKPGDSR